MWNGTEWIREEAIPENVPLVVDKSLLTTRSRLLFETLEEKLLDLYCELEGIDLDPSLEDKRAEVEQNIQLFHCLLEPEIFRLYTITGPEGWHKDSKKEIPIEDATPLLKLKKSPFIHKAIAEKMAKEEEKLANDLTANEMSALQQEAHIEFLKVILIDMYT